MLTHLPGILLPKHHRFLKIAKQVLEIAHKVKLYRGDVLRAEDLAEQDRLADQLVMLVKRSAQPAETEPAITALHEVLVRNGGKVYPVTGTADFVEMIVMAAIVAGAIRSFLLQPFKIPTNSMWPTYNGMTSVVRAPGTEVPSLVTRTFEKIQWTWTYVERAPVEGEVKIPLDNAGFDGKDKHYRPRGRNAVSNDYMLVVGNTPMVVDVPADFGLEGVLLRTYYPDYAKLALRRQDNERWDKLLVLAGRDNRIENGPNGPMLLTGYKVKAGQPVLNFDILTGDMLFVDRVSYNFVNPSRGDTFVFKTNNIPGLNDRNGNPSQNYYVKRLAGVPGERLFVDGDGRLYVNGKVVTSPEPMVLNSERATDRGYYGYLADLGDYAYAIPLNKEYIVTDRHYYALGDNSANSFDSRGWGEVPEKDVVGKPLFILHPFTSHWGAAK
ncbi:MAG: signal peptidase I [Verrucomicrobiota bacterium]